MRHKILNKIIFFTFYSLYMNLSFASEQMINFKGLNPPKNLHPFLLDDFQLSELFYRKILVFDKMKKSWVCDLCENVPNQHDKTWKYLSRNGESLQSLRFDLRKDAYWGDGTAITNRDVSFSWRVWKSFIDDQSDAGFYLHAIYDVVTTTNNLQSFTILFYQDFYQPTRLEEFRIIPEHLEANKWKQAGGSISKYLEKSSYSHNDLNCGLFSGAICLVDAAKFSYKKNKFYKGEYLNFDPEWQSAKQVFIYEKKFYEPSNLLKPRKARDEIELIGFNHRNPYYNSAIQRKPIADALRYSISKFSEKLLKIDHFLFSYNMSIKTQPKSLCIQYDSSHTCKKKRQIQIAMNQDKSRKKFIYELNKVLSKIGLELIPKVYSEAIFKEKVLTKADFNELVMFALTAENDFNLQSLFSSKHIPSYVNGYEGSNILGLNDPQIDQFIKELDSESQSKMREQIFKNYSQKLYELNTVIPVGNYFNFYEFGKG